MADSGQRTFQAVRLKRGGTNFEVLCNLNTVEQFRAGDLGFSEVLASEDVFKVGARNDAIPDAELEAAFGTADPLSVAQIIVEEGDLQLTAADRKARIEKKRLEIVNYIHKYYVDPKNKLPHPVVRIENAITEAKFRVDGDKPADRQTQDCISALRGIIPLRKMEILGTLRMPHASLGAGMGVVHQWCEILRENYDADGCEMEISMVPGDYDAFLADMSNAVQGNFDFNVGDQGGGVVDDDADEGTSGGKKKGKGKKKKGKQRK